MNNKGRIGVPGREVAGSGKKGASFAKALEKIYEALESLSDGQAVSAQVAIIQNEIEALTDTLLPSVAQKKIFRLNALPTDVVLWGTNESVAVEEVYSCFLQAADSITCGIVSDAGKLYLAKDLGSSQRKITSFYNSDTPSTTYNPYIEYDGEFYTVDSNGVLTPIAMTREMIKDVYQVTAQALCDLEARVRGIMSRLENLGEVKATTVDSENLPKVCGQPLVIQGTGAPAVVPQFAGQRYHDTTNKKVYEAFDVTASASDWVLLN